MNLNEFSELTIPLVDEAIQKSIRSEISSDYAELRNLLDYQFGYDQGAKARRSGKRIRPLICLLAADATNGDWKRAVPAAASIEMIHNFTLIHDDIEDKSETRRGRPTLWKKVGEALAINAGDALYALAFTQISKLEANYSAEVYINVFRILASSVLNLTGGQHLDIASAGTSEIGLDGYWSMIRGKTSTLITEALAIGALCGAASDSTLKEIRKLGNYIGMGFQIYDDYLGIWGDESSTGKSASTDLVEGKKSFPIITGLQMGGRFSTLFAGGKVESDDVYAAKRALEADGIMQLTLEQANHFSRSASATVDKLNIGDTHKAMFRELIQILINRKG